MDKKITKKNYIFFPLKRNQKNSNLNIKWILTKNIFGSKIKKWSATVT